MSESSESISILSLFWDHGGASLGYAWCALGNLISDNLTPYSSQEGDFPWNSVFESENPRVSPTIYVGTIHGKQIHDSSVLHALRSSTLPSLYLVPQRTLLPSPLTENMQRHENTHSLSRERSNYGSSFLKSMKESQTSRSAPRKEVDELVLPSPKVKYMHPVQFSADMARESISNMNFNMDNGTNETEIGFDGHIHYEQQLSFHIDTRSKSMMSALGGLFSYLQRNFASLFPNYSEPSRKCGLRILPHQMHFQVFIEENTYVELEIFKREPHPASHQFIGSPKEGLSLFGVISRFCRTGKGCAFLREILIRPTNDVTVLKDRLKKISFLCENQDFTLELHKKLHSVDHPVTLFHRLFTGVHSPSDWQKLFQIAGNYRLLLEMLYASPLCQDVCAFDTPDKAQQLETTCDLLNSQSKTLCTPTTNRNYETLPRNVLLWCESLQNLRKTIEDVLDIPESASMNRYTIRKGYHKELDRLYILKDTMSEFLTNVAQKEIESLPEQIAFMLTLNVVYIPQFGYYIALPGDFKSDEWVLNELVKNFAWTKEFFDEESVFFKNKKMRELDEQLGDVHGSIQDMELSIIRRLEESTVRRTNIRELFSTYVLSSHVGRVDALCAMSHAANEYGWLCPSLQKDPIIFIRNGRHPLLKNSVSHPSIGNDTHLHVTKGPTVSIVTGANGSGKSVYLKQVALLAYMAHVGSFVPAEKMTIGPLSAIMTCIGSPMHRSFAADLARVGRMLRFPIESTRYRPLLLIDEFGKGTLAQDGIALLTAVVSDLLNRNQTDAPFVVMSTHYTEIFRNLASSVERDKIDKILEVSVMKVVVSEASSEDLDHKDSSLANLTHLIKIETGFNREINTSVRYTYRKFPGIGGNTYSLPLAMKCGVPKKIVQLAECAWRGLTKGKSLSEIIDEEKLISELEDIYENKLSWTQKWLEKNSAHDIEGMRKYIVVSNRHIIESINEIAKSANVNPPDSLREVTTCSEKKELTCLNNQE